MSKNHYIIPIFVPHEGCPHNCVFCNQVRITGVEKVEKENNKEEQGVNAKKVREIVDEYLKTLNKDATIEISFLEELYCNKRGKTKRTFSSCKGV